MDWSDGAYELTAAQLAPAAEAVVTRAGVGPGQRVLDVGCGTGNATLAAARRGAEVHGVDPAARLVEVARARAAEAGLRATFEVGEAGALPAPDACFDAVLSVFAVIFAPDAEAAARELVRVTKPGGAIVLTSWVDAGSIAEVGHLVRRALVAASPPPAPGAPPARPPLAWGDRAFVRDLFAPLGTEVTVDEGTVTFEAASAAAWFDEQGEHHPVWRFARRLLSDDAWRALRSESVTRLEAMNEAPGALRIPSRYLLVHARRPLG